MSDEQKGMALEFSVLPERLAVARLEPDSPIPTWAMGREFFSVTRTPEELSIAAPDTAVPDRVRAVRGWRAIKVHGPFDFSTVGVLASLAAPLAAAGISLFAVSTFDTDYLLVREATLSQAIEVLRQAGHVLRD
jgi:uncharacterized protein